METSSSCRKGVVLRGLNSTNDHVNGQEVTGLQCDTTGRKGDNTEDNNNLVVTVVTGRRGNNSNNQRMEERVKTKHRLLSLA